jgi:hypothetical protein
MCNVEYVQIVDTPHPTPPHLPERYCDGLKQARVWFWRMEIHAFGILQSGHVLIYFNWISYRK